MQEEIIRCDINTAHCSSQQEALTRLLQDRDDLTLYGLQCCYEMPAGWYPDHLVDPPECLQTGWRTWIEIDLIRVRDRGWVSLLPVDASTEDVSFCQNLVREFVAGIDGDLIRCDRFKSALVYFQTDDEPHESESVISIQSWPEIVDVLDRVLIPSLHEEPDASACDRLYPQLVGRRQLVHFVRSHEAMIKRLISFDELDFADMAS